MAVDGRKLRESISYGSDNFCEFPCSPCAKEGKTLPGVKHCVDCDENICASCLKDHNKFAVMRGHQMLDKVQNPSGQRHQLPSQRCSKHGGKQIEVYCPSHDTVGCSICITIEHSACQGVTFIPDVAKSVNTSKELETFEDKMADLLSRFVSLKQKKDINLDDLRQDKERLHKEVRALRKSIGEHLDKMEQELINDVNSKIHEKMQIIDSDKKNIDRFLAEIKKCTQQLKEAKDDNESDVFVLLKSGYSSLKESCDFADSMECSADTGRLRLKVEENLQRILDCINSVGRIAEDFVAVSASFQGEYNMRVDRDKQKCTKVYGICLSEQGNIIITDFKNNQLKKLDSTYTITSRITLPGSPSGICQVNESDLAVTLQDQKKVQFVSNTEPMNLLSSFSVGDNCRGIVHSNALLYVCCGGSRRNAEEGPGHLEIYTLHGVLLKSIFESMELPADLVISSDGNILYIADTYKGLIMMDTGGRILAQHYFQELKLSIGLCKLSDDKVCLAGNDSNNIVIVTDDGKIQQSLLTQADGMTKPQCLCFDAKRSLLMVSMLNKEVIRVYHLKMKNVHSAINTTGTIECA